VSLGDVQLRIATIQSQMASVAALSAPARTGTATGTNSAAGSTGVQFAAALDSAVSAQQGADWVVPVKGKLTSHFGPRWGSHHAGIDIAAPTGTPVHAAGGGIVKKANWDGGYGNAVVIDHGNGVLTRYAHNSELVVKPGQRVKPGDLIAKVGSTGDSTGPHVHLELQINGKKVDPLPWLKARGISW
jgi:murein DD-endopeptidase MepM/ murein hydrolase activator NlpD